MISIEMINLLFMYDVGNDLFSDFEIRYSEVYEEVYPFTVISSS